MIASGGVSGGISSRIAGGSFMDGFKQGLITSGLNHVAHSTFENFLDDDQNPIKNQQKKSSWDLNRDEKLQKNEADKYYLEGNGKEIFVDGNKIDLTGLKAKHMTYNSKTDTYSLSTTKAFEVLPWETASTYGGSTFKLIDGKFRMLSQEYHYESRPWNSLENIGRNILNDIGKPSGYRNNRLYPGKYTPKSYFINIRY